jgi:actin-like ATPase involved in cell morphogenesis
MINIGIDVGTSHIKVFSADADEPTNGKFMFPSVYATRKNDSGEKIESVGNLALKMNIHKNTKLVWPVIKGSIEGSEEEAEALIRAAISKVAGNTPYDQINVGLGLPLRAVDDGAVLEEILVKNIGVNSVGIWNQTQGTLSDQGVDTAIVVSMGHGTTEIMAYYELTKIDGVSLKKAADTILDSLGGNKFLKHDYIEEHKADIKDQVEMLVDEVVNQLRKIKDGIQDEEIDTMPILITGGGTQIPGVKEQLEKKMPYAFKIVKEPVYSIAKGLYKNIALQETPDTEDVVTAPKITTS